ncbi:hypothetical protein BG000_004350 [Podila horticola]|nr:hypothetical protein BG000_004350 [Podila horticola]
MEKATRGRLTKSRKGFTFEKDTPQELLLLRALHEHVPYHARPGSIKHAWDKVVDSLQASDKAERPTQPYFTGVTAYACKKAWSRLMEEGVQALAEMDKADQEGRMEKRLPQEEQEEVGESSVTTLVALNIASQEEAQLQRRKKTIVEDWLRSQRLWEDKEKELSASVTGDAAGDAGDAGDANDEEGEERRGKSVKDREDSRSEHACDLASSAWGSDSCLSQDEEGQLALERILKVLDQMSETMAAHRKTIVEFAAQRTARMDQNAEEERASWTREDEMYAARNRDRNARLAEWEKEEEDGWDAKRKRQWFTGMLERESALLEQQHNAFEMLVERARIMAQLKQ